MSYKYKPTERIFRRKADGFRVKTIGRRVFDIAENGKLIPVTGSVYVLLRATNIWEQIA